MSKGRPTLRLGVGGPVGSGKTTLVDTLCKRLRERYRMAVVTNDIYTQEDAQYLTRSGALEPDRILGVETGGCPHTAIREDPRTLGWRRVTRGGCGACLAAADNTVQIGDLKVHPHCECTAEPVVTGVPPRLGRRRRAGWR